jgi:hypothetical protein
MKHYIKTVKKHLWKVVPVNQTDWDERLPISLLAYRASTHDTMGLTLASLVFGRELRLSCNLLFGAPPDKKWPTIDHAADLVDCLHNIRNFVHQHLKLVSDQIKTWYGRMANSAGYQKGDKVWLYAPTCTTGKSPKLQSLWKGPYRVVTQINDVVYRIQQNPRTKMMMVYLDRLTSYHGNARDKQP